MKRDSKNNSPSKDDLEMGLRFEFDSLIEEYKAIRQELHIHLANQDQLINYAIAFIALLVTVGQYVTGTYSYLAPLVTLGASIVFASLSLMFIRYDVNISICSGYITYILKPRIERLIFQTQKKKSQVFLWENENIKFRLSRKHVMGQYINTMGRQGILIVPSLGLLLFYVFNRNFSLAVPLWENLILGVSAVTNLSIIISLFYAVSLYAKGNPIFETPSK
jgi:hypothetical protein